jgi:hypothetical protein
MSYQKKSGSPAKRSRSHTPKKAPHNAFFIHAKPLPPDKFVEAWIKATAMSNAENVTPLATGRTIVMECLGEPDETDRLRLSNNEQMRILSSLVGDFSGKDAAAAAMRFFALGEWISKGKLKDHFDPEQGVSYAALRTAAKAPLQQISGSFIEATFYEMLAEESAKEI